MTTPDQPAPCGCTDAQSCLQHLEITDPAAARAALRAANRPMPTPAPGLAGLLDRLRASRGGAT